MPRPAKKEQPAIESSAKLKYMIIGGSVLLTAIAGTAVGIIAVGSFQAVTVCRKIKEAKALGLKQIEGKFKWLDVNLCRGESCSFDTNACDVECPFEYEQDANSCPISCECAPALRGTFQGDIQIENEEMQTYLVNFGYMNQRADFLVSSKSSLRQGTQLWETAEFDLKHTAADRTNIRYYIAENLDPASKQAIVNAIRKLESLSNCIQFQRENKAEFTDLKLHRIFFIKGDGCWSGVGRHKEKSVVNVGIGCADESIIMHMLYHRLGFHHEHSRPDREETINIHLQNMDKSRRKAFQKLKKAVDTKSQYDLRSLLQLDGFAMSNNGEPTIVVKLTGKVVSAQSASLSHEDVRELNNVYCQSSTSSAPLSDAGAPTGLWATWGSYGKCSKSCGEDGFKMRKRFCPSGADQCGGSKTEYTPCPKPPCRDLGSFESYQSSLSSWASSSYSADPESVHPSDPEIDPLWSNEDDDTLDAQYFSEIDIRRGYRSVHAGSEWPYLENFELDDNFTGPVPFPHWPLPVNASDAKSKFKSGWSQWSGYGECSKTCGVGFKERTRVCRLKTGCFGEKTSFQVCVEPSC